MSARRVRPRTLPVLLALAASGWAASACSDFLAVDNPTVVDADALDPTTDLPTFSRSARQNFTVAAGSYNNFAAYLVWEAWPAETFLELVQFGLRNVVRENGTLNGGVWAPLSLSLRSADKVVEVAAALPNAAASIDLARAALFAGFSLQLMAEGFCQGVINGGPPLTTSQVLDSAVVRFTRAVDVGRAAAQGSTGAAQAEASQIVDAALVGRARAH